jgi:hypothetical protein
MFFAQMYSYGRDLHAVGITGIMGCMGLIVTRPSPGNLYSVHVPEFGSVQAQANGVQAFADFIFQQEMNAQPPRQTTQALCVLNGDNRYQDKQDTFAAIVAPLMTRLGLRDLQVVRIYGNFTNKVSKGTKYQLPAIAIAMSRKGQQGFSLRFKPEAEVRYAKGVNGGGMARHAGYGPLANSEGFMEIRNAHVDDWPEVGLLNSKRYTTRFG